MPGAAPAPHEQLRPNAKASTAAPRDQPGERLDGVAVDGRELEALEVGAPGLREAGLAHVDAAHLPASGRRERSCRRDQFLVRGGVCDGYEKRHPASTCQGRPSRRRSL